MDSSLVLITFSARIFKNCKIYRYYLIYSRAALVLSTYEHKYVIDQKLVGLMAIPWQDT